VRVRVYADGDYRRQTPRWEQRIEAQFERASEVTEKQFGVRLQVESIRPWERASSAVQLDPVFGELAMKDAGAGVDWVVGFVSSLDVVTSAQEQLGMAQLFGRHLVLRGMFSAAETDELSRALNLLPTTDRETLARERRVHKETAVLLHEWGHTLGALHELDRHSLMAPVYDPSETGFSDASAGIVRLGLQHRGEPEAWERAWGRAIDDSAAAWDPDSVRLAKATAGDFLHGRSARGPALPEDDARKYNEAIQRRSTGDAAGAWAALSPLVSRYPKMEAVQEFACSLAPLRKSPPAETLATCRAAAALPGAHAETLLYTASLLVDTRDRGAALAMLWRVETKLPGDAENLATLAELYLRESACFAATRVALRAAAPAQHVVAACSHLRHFVGFPLDPSGLPPEREADYVAAVQAAHADIDAQHNASALARARDLARDFPGTPGSALIECRVQGRGRALAPIKSACATAARAAPEAFLPQYILGLVAGAEGHWRDAGDAMRRALALDDSTPQVWASLAAVALKLGDTAAGRDLSSRFQKQFRQRLRPSLWPAGWVASR
jgi:tetratricopeptide (TPR) repeat protein